MARTNSKSKSRDAGRKSKQQDAENKLTQDVERKWKQGVGKMKSNMNIGMLVAALGVFALLTVVLTHTLLYVVTRSSANDANEQAAMVAAGNAARNVTNLVGLLNQSVVGQAADPKLASLVAQADPAIIRQEEERITHALPNAWLVRLLPENIDVPDETRAPKMGFSDLNMVKIALTETPQPGVFLANSPDAHLAMARRFANGGGVLHVSWPARVLAAAIAGEGACAIELRQENISLAYQGAPNCKEQEAAGEKAITGTPWKIVYWVRLDVEHNMEWFVGALAGGAVLITVITFLVLRLLYAFLRQDQKNLIDMIHDLYIGDHPKNPIFKLNDFVHLADEVSLLKRTVTVVKPSDDYGTEFNAPVMKIDLEKLAAAGDDKTALFQPTGPEEPLPVALDDTPLVRSPLYRAYDIRGVVGDTLTAKIIYDIGLAIGSEMAAKGEKNVAIARDCRLSSDGLNQSLVKGLMDSGRMVINLGQIPTPLLYYATHALNAQSGVMLTGGHNPSNYNGLKVIIGGDDLCDMGIQRLRQRIEQGDFVKGSGQMQDYNLIPEYIERVVSDTQLGRDMKVVVDCGNGMASLIAPELIRALGCEVIELFSKVDGQFPNHFPDPCKPENLQALIDKVLETGADLGVAFNVGGDGWGMVDSNGKIIWPDRQMMLFAADVLSREPGSDIIYDVKSSRHLPSQIVKNGGRPLMWRSGHSPIKAKMKESGAMLAGEMSGHIYFQERWFGFDDGIYACARMIEILSVAPEDTTAEVFAKLPDSFSTPELSVELPEGENFALMEEVLKLANFSDARITTIDGLRVDFLDGWGLVRASNTIPALTFRFEADSEKSLVHIQQQFEYLLRQVKEDIELPF